MISGPRDKPQFHSFTTLVSGRNIVAVNTQAQAEVRRFFGEDHDFRLHIKPRATTDSDGFYWAEVNVLFPQTGPSDV